MGKKRKEFDEKGIKDSTDYYADKLKNINTEMLDFINNEIIGKHPEYLFSKMQKSYMEVDVPEFKKKTELLTTRLNFTTIRTTIGIIST